MKKYLLFCGNNYYPKGGIGDYEGDFDSVEDALSWMLAQNSKYDWYDIIEHATMTVVREFPQ